MSNKFTCSFPEFNFPNLSLNRIQKLQRKVRCISSDHCSKQIWVYRAVTFSSHKKDPSNKKTKTHEQLCKAHPPPTPRPSSVCDYLFSKIQKHLELKASETISFMNIF